MSEKYEFLSLCGLIVGWAGSAVMQHEAVGVLAQGEHTWQGRVRWGAGERGLGRTGVADLKVGWLAGYDHTLFWRRLELPSVRGCVWDKVVWSSSYRAVVPGSLVALALVLSHTRTRTSSPSPGHQVQVLLLAEPGGADSASLSLLATRRA